MALPEWQSWVLVILFARAMAAAAKILENSK
jgi:hypothetical protein